MNLHESVAKAVQAYESSLPKADRGAIDNFESQYQKLLGRGLIEEAKYNLAPISTLPIGVGCVLPNQK